MRRRDKSIVASALAIAVVASVAVAASASAQDDTIRVDSQLITPAYRDSGTQWFSGEQIDEVWASVTKNFPFELPQGQTLRTTTPEFFHPDDGKIYRWEAGLPDLIAARLWRCSWIEVELESSSTDKTAQKMLDAYWTLPSVTKFVDNEEYRAQMQEIADWMETDALSAEYAVDCEGGSN